MQHVKPIGPLRLEGNIAENWRKWKQRWTLYAKASGADAKDKATQCAVFLHTIGGEALEVYDTFTFTESEKGKIEPLITKFEAYCSPKKNVTYERYLFFSCTQNSRSIDAIVTDLRMKSKTCEFENLHDSLIKDRIVCGIDNNSIRERLLRNNELTLEVAINTVRAAETSKTQVETLTNPPPPPPPPPLRSISCTRQKKESETKTSTKKSASEIYRPETDQEALWSLRLPPQTKRMQSIWLHMPQMSREKSFCPHVPHQEHKPWLPETSRSQATR